MLSKTAEKSLTSLSEVLIKKFEKEFNSEEGILIQGFKGVDCSSTNLKFHILTNNNEEFTRKFVKTFDMAENLGANFIRLSVFKSGKDKKVLTTIPII